MTSDQLNAFQTTFMANVNPNAQVNFVPFNPNDHSRPDLAVGAASTAEFNSATATQTGPAVQVQTLQIISQP